VTLTYVLMQNLRRNPLRTSLTAAAFALPMAVFVAAISFVVVLPLEPVIAKTLRFSRSRR